MHREAGRVLSYSALLFVYWMASPVGAQDVSTRIDVLAIGIALVLGGLAWMERAQALGAIRTLPKPYEAMEPLEVVTQALARARESPSVDDLWV